MPLFLTHLFSSDFMPHGFCYRWAPDIVWLHAISDAVITLSYYLIPVALIIFVRKRRDVPFHWMFVMFGVFIFGCGTTHLMEVWTIWHGTYRLAGVIKALTAIASASTAVLLVPLLPKAVAIPSPTQLNEANRHLQEQIEERQRLERAMLDVGAREQRRIGQDLHDDLGQRLTGIALLAKTLEDELAVDQRPECERAAQVVKLIAEAIRRTRDLSRGMSPVIAAADGLMIALKHRAHEIASTANLNCHFECATPVEIQNPEVAYHLYYLAQEATSNAIKHGKPREIGLVLSAYEQTGRLVIRDDGMGFDPGKVGPGLGRHTMENRAKLIGGSLDVRSSFDRGTTVTCTFPLASKALASFQD